MNCFAKIFFEKIKNIELIQQGQLIICSTSESVVTNTEAPCNHLEAQCNGMGFAYFGIYFGIGIVIDAVGGDVVAQSVPFMVKNICR